MRRHVSRPVEASAGGALEVERWRGNDRAISSTICRVEARRRSAWALRGGRDDSLRARSVDAGRGAAPLLETRGLTKAFGPVEVLSDISLAFRAGEVHAIIGENGAGKSTLMKIISGHLDPTRGSLKFDGAPLTLRGPVDAERRGIVLVHQEIMLAPDLSIAENMFLGRELRRGVAVDDRTMNARAEEAMRVFGVDVSVTVPVQRLSIARRQLAQIARALAVPHRIAIFDEPTASLTPVETGALLKLIRELKAKGIAVVYISHRLEEVKAIADVVTVLRDGKHVATSPAARIAAGRHGASDGRTRPAGALSAARARADRRARLRRLRLQRAGLRGRRELRGAAGRDPRLFRPDRGRPHRVVRGAVRPAQGRRRHPPRRRGRSAGRTRAAP